jgi:hypothetical protein
MSRKKTMFIGLLGVCIVLLAILVAVLALASWIINQSPVKERIEAAASRALGGHLTYDHASLSLVVHPHMVFHGLRLSIPGALSGSALSLETHADLRPLLTGTVRVTDVVLDHPDVTVTRSDHGIRTDEQASSSESSSEAVMAALGAVAVRMPSLTMAIRQGQLAVMEETHRDVTLREVDARIKFLPTEPVHQEGPAEAAPFNIVGDFRGVVTDVPGLPGPMTLAITQFDARPETVLISNATARLLDTSFNVSGVLDQYLTTQYSGHFTIDGAIGPEIMRWVRTLSFMPSEMTLEAPITLSRSRFEWHSDGTVRLQGEALGQHGLSASFDVSRTPERFSLQALKIRDAESQAALTLTLRKKTLILTFSGHLTQTTLDHLFQHQRFQFGWIRGDLDARIALDRPSDSTVRGTLEGKRLVPPIQLNEPVIIDRVSLKAAGRTVTVNPLVVTVGGTSHTIKGSVTTSANEWHLNLKTDGLEWEPLQALFAPAMKPGSTKPAPPGARSIPVRVILKLDAASFTAKGWTARPARAEIAFTPNATNIRIDEAGVCGLRLFGTAIVQPADLNLNFKATANRRSLASTLTCLSIRDLPVTGTYDLSGAFTSRGEARAWLDHLQGTVSFTSTVEIKNHQSTTRHTITGNAALTVGKMRINLKSDGLEWEPIRALFESVRKNGEQPVQSRPVTLLLNSDYFSAAGWTARPIRAEIAITPDSTRIRIDEAGVCAIHLSGTATVQPAHLELHFRTTATRLPLAPSVDCLSGRNLRITGTYDLSGAFTSTGEPNQWFDHLLGSVSLTARNGRVYRAIAFTRALEYLNTTNLIQGKFPDPERDGVAYDSITLMGAMEQRVLRISQFVVVSPVADVTGRGSINLADQTMDSVYLIAPFPKADTVVKNIPLLRDILGKSLVTIPVRVQGPYKDPTVTPLPPGEVADDIAKMMDRILTLPFKIMSPFIP